MAPRVLPLLLHKELKGDVCVSVDVDGSTVLSSSAPCLKKQAGTLWSSQAVWGQSGIQSSISIVLLLFSLIFQKHTPFSAFTTVSDVLISLCMTYTFVG